MALHAPEHRRNGLAAQASSEPRLTNLERNVITATSIAGILGAMRFGPQGPLSNEQEAFVANIGLLIYVLSAATAAYCILLRLLVNPRSWVTPVFLVAVTAFFAPTFFFSNYVIAVFSYALAHALQYWFLISLVAIGSGKKMATPAASAHSLVSR